MAITLDGIFVNGQKATFHPEDILSGDASAYTEEIGTAVEAWMEENVTGGEQVTDTTLTLPGVPADAEVTGDKIEELKEDLNAVSNLETFSKNLSDWSKGTWHATNGSTFSSDIYIRTNTDLASTFGDNKVTVDSGYVFQVFAYVLEGTYVGVLLTDGTFAKTWDNHANVSEFSVYEYPNYKFRIAVKRADGSDSITTDDSSHCHVISRKLYYALDNINRISAEIGDARISPFATSENYGIRDNGYAIYTTAYKAIKYKVIEGASIWIECPSAISGRASYQFQSAPSISQSGAPYLIGTPVSAKTSGLVTVPEGAKYLIFGILKDDTSSGVYDANRITSIQNELEAFYKFRDGIDVTLNLESADNGNNYGTHDVAGTFYKGTTLTVKNENDTNNNFTIYIRSGDTVVQSFSVTQGSTVSVALASNADTIRVYCNVYPTKGHLSLEPVDICQNNAIEKLQEYFGYGNDIVSLNYKVPMLVKSAQKILYGQTIQPLSLLHFSDPHGSATNVSRIMQMAESLGTLLDDVVCTGDMVSNQHSDGFTWWSDVGADDVLTCIGNHDVSDGSSYSQYGITPEQAYNTYFAPFISEWGVTHTGSLTYYYKDYADKKIRMIVLDYLLTENDATAQNTWLQSVLSDAKANDYTVVILQHCPVSNEASINCSFSMLNKVSTYSYPVIYQQTVQNFIDGGGKFACYLVGHTHWDMVCYNSDYPDQICIAITCAATTGRDNDQVRSSGTKSQDAANVVTIDATTHTVKLIRIGADIDNYLRGRNICTIDYTNKSIISDA